MATVHLSDYVRRLSTGAVSHTPYGTLPDHELARFLSTWPDLHQEALDLLGDGRIHPSAFVHRTAIIGDDVILGPRVHIHEFSTVRKGTVLAAGVSVGFNCEVTACYVGENTVLGHRIGINRTIVGSDVHLSATVTVAAINMCNDMRHPDREVITRGPGCLYRFGTSRFGGVIGDGVQTGNNISLGPGILLGRRCRVDSGVTFAARAVAENSTISAPHTADTRIRARRTAT